MSEPRDGRLDLGSLLDEVKEHCTDPAVLSLLAELIDFEKSYPYSYKAEIQGMLARRAGSGK